MIDAVREAREWPCDNDTYHATTQYVSHSGLKVFGDKPRLYHGMFVAKTIPWPDPTEAMLMGTWLHTAVLEPERWASDFCCDLPAKCSDGLEWNWRKPSHRKERDAFLELHPNALEPEQRKLVERMRDAVLRHELAATLLSKPGPTEHSIVWPDDVTGLLCKSRRDKLACDSPGPTIIADWKTSTDPSPLAFAHASYEFKYYRQAAFYLEGHRALTGEDAKFLFVCVGKVEPYSVVINELTEQALELGAHENRILLNRLARCHETGDWSAAYESQVNRVDLPRYAYTQALAEE